jgi:hypothetical protein
MTIRKIVKQTLSVLWKERVIWFPVLLASILVLSCSGSEAEKQNVLDTVKKYNSRMKRAYLEAAYLEANLNLMVSVTTEDQMRKLFPTIQALQVANSFMIANQNRFIVKKISVKGDRASVKTEEEWVYWWQNKDTMKITKPEKTITYMIEYVLLREDGHWKVDDLESLE